MISAIVKISGKQYQVREGDSLLVDRISQDKGSEVSFDQVYLLNIQGKIRVGQPLVSGVKVLAVVEEQLKGAKITVAKFKSKVRYRRKKGFRAQLTKIKIIKITTGQIETKVKTEVKEKSTKSKK